MLKRRDFVSSIMFSGVLLNFISPARANPVAIAAVAVAIEKVANALGAVSENVLKVIQNGLKTWSTLEAVGARRELTTLAQTLSRFYAMPNAAVRFNLDAYIRRWEVLTKNGTKSDLSAEEKIEMVSGWERLQATVSDTLRQATGIIGILSSNKSPFVATDVYTDLTSALSGRAMLLDSVSRMEAPQTKSEIAELRRVAAAYQLLRENLRKAISSLNKYVSAITEGKK